jgi:phosphoribosylformylglycinamidine cyclo-ligase
MGLTYRDSGVDVEGGNNFVKKIAPHVKKTFTERVITEIGGFGALYNGSFPQMKNPVLVSGTDGVGTKLKIAQQLNKHDTIGIDAVAMCVNDIITSGAQPLFFLDYISCGKLKEDVHVDVVKGIAEGCLQSGCSLIGGETAEHPGVMDEDDYDIAGFAVGVVDREKIINGSGIGDGDVIIGLPSSGIHSNGYSMVRKLFFDIKNYTLDQKFDELNDTLGMTLITPTRLYANAVTSCINKEIPIKGIVHITGGGFYENIPRILPDNTSAEINLDTWEPNPIFKLIQKEGDVSRDEMFTTFNMGIGMIFIVSQNDSDAVMDTLSEAGEEAAIIGSIVKNEGSRVILK